MIQARYALGLTADRVQADDLVSDTLERAWVRRDSFQQQFLPPTWLNRIMHNLAVDKARRRKEHPVDPEQLWQVIEQRWRDEDHSVDAETAAIRAEDLGVLQDALSRLPLVYRGAVLCTT